MKTPEFWRTKNLLSTLLTPIGAVYGLATYLRMKITKPGKADSPVICIGNLTAGGTGKTPVSISIAKLLQDNGKNPFFISRGYGGQLRDVIVNAHHHAGDVGDEPLLLSRQAHVVVNPDRFEGALKACQKGADVIIMDDGFQNPKLYKDLSFIVVDGGYGFGNGRCIPAGPLRESIDSGLKRADAIIVVSPSLAVSNLKKLTKLPIFNAYIAPIEPEGTTNKDVVAFAGIGRPQKFYESLKGLGFNLVQTISFPDHHQYTEEELQQIIALAKSKKLAIFTTSKDFVKIPQTLRKHFKVLEIDINWEDKNKLLKFILNKI